MNRRYEQTAEFRERQGSFDFAAVALFVQDLAASVRASLKGYIKGLFKRPKISQKSPLQLALFGTTAGLFGGAAAFTYQT